MRNITDDAVEDWLAETLCRLYMNYMIQSCLPNRNLGNTEYYKCYTPKV